MPGSKNATIEKINVNDIVNVVLVLTTNELQLNGAVVQTDFAQNLPLAAGDWVQVQQVVLNLLLNAMDAMHTTSETPKAIQIRTRISESDDIRIDISDCGPGFEPAMVEKIFEAFYTTKANGMGFGLSVSQAIIESLEGSLQASRNDKQGATFSFTLRLTSGEAASPAAKAAQALGESSNSA